MGCGSLIGGAVLLFLFLWLVVGMDAAQGLCFGPLVLVGLMLFVVMVKWMGGSE